MSKVLVVTGGSRGIGHSVSIGAIKRGWRVCVNFVTNSDRADQTVDLIKNMGGEAIAVQADICHEDDIIRLFDICETKLGPVEGFVNSAGIVEPYGRIDELKYEELLPLINLNVNAAIIGSREAVNVCHQTTAGMVVLLYWFLRSLLASVLQECVSPTPHRRVP